MKIYDSRHLWTTLMLKKYFCYLSFLKYFSSLTFSCVNMHMELRKWGRTWATKKASCVLHVFFSPSYARKLDNIAVIDAYIMLLRSIQLGSVTLLLNMVDKNGSFRPAVTHVWGGLVSIWTKPKEIFSHMSDSISFRIMHVKRNLKIYSTSSNWLPCSI